MNAAALALEFPEPSKNWVTQRYTLFCSLLQHLCGAIDANLGTCTPACKRQRRLADKEMIDPELALISRLFIFLVYVSLFSIRQNWGEKESRSPFILASSLDNITIFHTHNLSLTARRRSFVCFVFRLANACDAKRLPFRRVTRPNLAANAELHLPSVIPISQFGALSAPWYYAELPKVKRQKLSAWPLFCALCQRRSFLRRWNSFSDVNTSQRIGLRCDNKSWT